jgi:phosphohistidine phosphatase
MSLIQGQAMTVHSTGIHDEYCEAQWMTTMPRELMLLRHGKSDWSISSDDFHRPLQLEGKRSAQRVGTWMMRQDLLPDHVVSSPAERACATAAKVCKVMAIGTRAIHLDERIYEADLAGLREVLADCPRQTQRVLLVGHNPGLKELLAFLLQEKTPSEKNGKILPTATLIRLDMPDDWSRLTPGCASLAGIIRPSTLPRKFPYPAPDGPGRRRRPAYYYNQSAVIPFRLHKGKPEILVIYSSNRKHWVVPKGIMDPGLSARQSAAKEAWEEAGVEGRIYDGSLGAYTCRKWGAACHVEVFAMEVTHLVPEKKWEESHRGREWLSPKQAAKRLKQKELKLMVMGLAKKLRSG